MGYERPEREAGYLPPSSTEVTKAWGCQYLGRTRKTESAVLKYDILNSEGHVCHLDLENRQDSIRELCTVVQPP